MSRIIRDKKQENRDSELVDTVCNKCSTDNPLTKSRKLSVVSYDHTGYKIDHTLCTCQQKEKPCQVHLPSSRGINSVTPLSERTVNVVYVPILNSNSTQSNQTNNSPIHSTITDHIFVPNTENVRYQTSLTDFRQAHREAYLEGQTRKYFLTITVLFALLCTLLLTNDYNGAYFILLLIVYLFISCFLFHSIRNKG